MQLEAKTYPWDMLQAVSALQEYCTRKKLEDHQRQRMLRSAVEREFQILGEAMLKLRRKDPKTAERIPNQLRIVGFRNILVHEYQRIEDAEVWRILEQDVAPLRSQLEALLGERQEKL